MAEFNALEPSASTDAAQTYTLDIAGHDLTLPIVPVTKDLAISLFMIIDHPISTLSHIGTALAALLRPLSPNILVAPATLGIPLAIEISRELGLERYVILQKSNKVHLADALSASITSITSNGTQRLLLDRKSVALLKGKRVCVVDDVIASGNSMKGALGLARKAEANIVGIGVVLTEGWEWKNKLAEDMDLVRELGHIPQFQPTDHGTWVAMADS